MFFTPRAFAGLNVTDESVELAFLSLERGEIHFVAAEKCERSRIGFSQEAIHLYKAALCLFSTLPIQKTLLKTLPLPPVKEAQKEQLAETLFQSSGLLERGQVIFSFAPAKEQMTHVFCAFKKQVKKSLGEFKAVGFEPHGLTAASISLANFAIYICHKSSGVFLHLHETSGIVVLIEEGLVTLSREFVFDSSHESITRALRIALDGISGETIWLTGPRSFDSELIHYLKAALGCAFQRPDFEKRPAPAKLCHNFALAIGSAIEASKLGKGTVVDFCKGGFRSRRLMWRGLLQEGLLALHVALVFGVCALFGHVALEKRGLEKAGATLIFSDEDIEPYGLISLFGSATLENLTKKQKIRVAMLEKERRTLPYAMRCPRAGSSLMQAAKKNGAYPLQKYSYHLDEKELRVGIENKGERERVEVYPYEDH